MSNSNIRHLLMKTEIQVDKEQYLNAAYLAGELLQAILEELSKKLKGDDDDSSE